MPSADMSDVDGVEKALVDARADYGQGYEEEVFSYPNVGPHILAAINMLDNILRRMQGHQQKKTPKLRKLSITEI